MKKTLIIVDYQVDFASPEGSLYVKGGETLYNNIISLAKSSFFDLKIATKDWHPTDHCSFKTMGGMWPNHCIRGTNGSALMGKELDHYVDYIVHKGTNKDIDSYSAFFDNERIKDTFLGDLVQNDYSSDKLSEVYICGLAGDYCVKYTALDALEFVTKVYVLTDVIRFVDDSLLNMNNTLSELNGKGIISIYSRDILGHKIKGCQ